jgi:hypothetical protein
MSSWSQGSKIRKLYVSGNSIVHNTLVLSRSTQELPAGTISSPDTKMLPADVKHFYYYDAILGSVPVKVNKK